MTLGDVYVRHRGKKNGAHFTEVVIGGLTLWFSYETLIAFQVSGKLKVIRENEWGTITGKHLAMLDGGGIDVKKYRLSYEEFCKEFARQTKEVINLS